MVVCSSYGVRMSYEVGKEAGRRSCEVGKEAGRLGRGARG